MKRQVLAAAAMLTACATAANAAELWNNGSIITHAGQGAGGADVSMAAADLNSAGFNAGTFGDGSYWRRADDFTVGGGGWNLDSITFYLYSSFSGPGATPWLGFDMNIWDGAPGSGSIVANSTSVVGTPTFTNIYRVFNGAANLTNTDRAVFAVTLDFSGTTLGEGDYWIDIQVDQGAGSAWIPPIMNADGSHYDGNQMQFGADNVWVTYEDAVSGLGADIPFYIAGEPVPAPGALALLGLAGLVGARRRRA